MNKKRILGILGIVILLLTSCESFLETENYSQTDSDNALKDVSAIKAAKNGLYNHLGSYHFCGRNLLAIGDLAADMAVANPGTGHYLTINTYRISDTEGNLNSIWEYGYKIVSNATKILAAANDLEKGTLPDKDKNELILHKAEVSGLRALAYFYMVNIFGLPYGTDDNAHGGLVLMKDKPIIPGTPVSRSSVRETYALINEDIANSIKSFDKMAKTKSFYLNLAGVYALKARVSLYQGDKDVAAEYAQKALDEFDFSDSKPISRDAYMAMWSSLAISEEEIFTIAKTTDDNLSANSLNTLYGSYGSKMTDSLYEDFSENDYRRNLIDATSKHPKKFDGIESSKATSNIPIFRVSEMKLIIAEALTGKDSDAARSALLYTASRNSDIQSVSDLPNTDEELLSFIALERKRELFQEGHRWYDARRTGEKISVSNGKFTDYDVSKFVYPIPAAEINSGYKCEQNEDWHTKLPQ